MRIAPQPSGVAVACSEAGVRVAAACLARCRARTAARALSARMLFFLSVILRVRGVDLDISLIHYDPGAWWTKITREPAAAKRRNSIDVKSSANSNVFWFYPHPRSHRLSLVCFVPTGSTQDSLTRDDRIKHQYTVF